VESLTVRNGTELIGFCFTSQDGNSLLSSIAATLWFMYPDSREERLDVIRPFLFREV
jgi:glyceraldehyde-3-phosphate dehydrogenase (NAD(P))